MRTRNEDTTDTGSTDCTNGRRKAQTARSSSPSGWKMRTAKVGFLLLLVIAAGGIFLTVQAELDRPADSSAQVAGTTEWNIRVGDQTYRYKVTYGKSFQLVSTEGDPWVTSHAGTQNCTDAKQLKQYLQEFVDEEGGTITVARQSGLEL